MVSFKICFLCLLMNLCYIHASGVAMQSSEVDISSTCSNATAFEPYLNGLQVAFMYNWTFGESNGGLADCAIHVGGQPLYMTVVELSTPEDDSIETNATLCLERPSHIGVTTDGEEETDRYTGSFLAQCNQEDCVSSNEKFSPVYIFNRNNNGGGG